uniref:Putative secreted protein n=1 Tax=Ixodes ricinus TaxID=34613 RepID=A0A6B0UE66_IXORI
MKRAVAPRALSRAWAAVWWALLPSPSVVRLNWWPKLAKAFCRAPAGASVPGDGTRPNHPRTVPARRHDSGPHCRVRSCCWHCEWSSCRTATRASRWCSFSPGSACSS